MRQPTSDFSNAADLKTTKIKPTPFSLRLSQDDRERLELAAGGNPVGAYIRSQLFGRSVYPRRRYQKAKREDAALAKLLAELGASRLSANLTQLAKSANMGTLPLTPDVVEELSEACAAVAQMRETLITALGLHQPPEASPSAGTSEGT